VVVVKLVLMSDTHMPGRGRSLPPRLWQAIEDADVVVHAGDWVGADLLDEVESRSRRLIGVYGNNDGPDLRARLPEVAAADLGGVRLVVVHETGASSGRERRCSTRYPEADVVVFGHSHIPWDTTSTTGLRLLNPGSPTDRRRQPTHTWMTVQIADGRLGQVELHHLES